ncbi:MAG: hypothetical protein E7615_05040 [Ruminococcaceae bacterium]|nr:hypothetical protein [Oscillospiraceae bacterium]
MLNKIKEKLHNKMFIKRLVAIFVAVLFIFGFSLWINISPSGALGKGFWAAVLYVAILGIISIVWNVVENRLAKTRGLEIEPLLGNMALDILPRLYMPVIISDPNGKIIWVNSAFISVSGSKNGFFGKNIDQICPNTLDDIINAADAEEGLGTTAFDQFYKVKAYPTKTASNKDYYITVWNNQNELNNAYKELKDENTIVAFIMIDNLDELLQHIQDKYREVSNNVATILNEWAESVNGILKEFQRDKYIFLFSEKHLEGFISSKFPILDKIRDVRVGSGGLPVTVSIGIAASGGTLDDKERDAQAALDMALQRGGDQAVIKTPTDMDIYGGRTQSIQKRTKVRSRVTANELIALMSDSSNVLIMGHINPDYDCFGACVGMARMAMFCGTDVNIIVDTEDKTIAKGFEMVKGMPEYAHMFVGAHEALDLIQHDTLLCICDVNNQRQLAAPEVAENVERIVYVDHHRKTAEFKIKPLIAYIEPSASSTCELVAEFLEQTLSAGMLPHEEANLLLSGIMLDTKHFSKNTGVRTFSAGTYLQNEGANPQKIQYLFKSDLDDLRREAKFETNVKIYRNMFAITTNTLKEGGNSDSADRIAAAKAADKLLTVDGVMASFAICKIENTVYISARSAGKVNVQIIAEKLGGGGHFDMAATQLKDVTVSEALNRLREAIDDYADTL